MSLHSPPFVALAKQFPDCPRCGHDLAGIVERALFCPGCGARLRATANRWDRAEAVLANAVYRISFGRFGRPPEIAAVPGDAPVCRIPILIGYSNALYTLGWRYERGGACARNLPEAIRCYRKSARLGNVDAIIRLAPTEASTPKPVIPIRT